MGKFRRLFGITLILIGVGIIATVAYKKIVTAHKQNELLEVFESQLAEANDEESTEPVSLESINGYMPIAIMEIPSIKLKQPVVDGVTEDVIKYISKRCKRKLVFHPHNVQNIIYGETEVIYNDVKKCVNL